MPLKISSDLNHLDLNIAHESSARKILCVERGEFLYNSMVASFVLLNEKILHDIAYLFWRGSLSK